MTRNSPNPQSENESEFPYWLVVALGLGAYFSWHIWQSDLYPQILATVSKGIGITIFVTLVSFAIASVLGLFLAVAVLSKRTWICQTARFYIEIVRGIPILVLLFYVAFVAGPGIVRLINEIREPLGFDPMRTRDLSLMWRAIIALSVGYSAYIAEVFRAGIQSIETGQVEAAKALGLSGWHRFRFIVLPQAVRVMLPPLGNFFIALIKDSSLVSVLGVADITQLGKVYAAGSFRYLETYNIVTFVYLIVTVGLSLLLRWVERWLNRVPSG